LDKFGTMIKNQLLQRGSNCRIIHEEDVTITNGRMKGRDIVYIAGTRASLPPHGASSRKERKKEGAHLVVLPVFFGTQTPSRSVERRR
jgi:hypothetical protein